MNTTPPPPPPPPSDGLLPYPCLSTIAAILGAVAPLTPNGLDDGHYTCPLCDGEGSIDGEVVTDHRGTTRDFPIGLVGVQCYGIGEGHVGLETALNGAPAEIARLFADLAAMKELTTRPPTPPAEVTPAMVECAVKAWLGAGMLATQGDAMRAALTAALAAKKESP